MRAQDVMALLCVGRTTIYKWVREGRIPCYRVSADDVRFDPMQLADWLEARAVK